MELQHAYFVMSNFPSGLYCMSANHSTPDVENDFSVFVCREYLTGDEFDAHFFRGSLVAGSGQTHKCNVERLSYSHNCTSKVRRSSCLAIYSAVRFELKFRRGDQWGLLTRKELVCTTNMIHFHPMTVEETGECSYLVYEARGEFIPYTLTG